MAIYNGKNSDSLNMLQYKRYSEKVATSASQVDPKNLPPTSAAAKYHSFRVFLQVNQWKDTECDMMPESWGWECTDAGFKPTTTDIAPAPQELLKIIRCNRLRNNSMQLSKAWNEMLYCLRSMSWNWLPKCYSFLRG